MLTDVNLCLWSLLCDLWLPYKDTSPSSCSSPDRRCRRRNRRRRSANCKEHLAGLHSRHKQTRAHSLYENEDRSDVIFFVGDDTDRQRIPAHSWILSARNHFFRAMFHETWADRHKNVYNIPNDPKGFQNLLKWLYRLEYTFQSLDSALTTLHVAIQYLCPELADLCIAYISQNLNEENVLKVLQQISRYCPSPFATAPSAPSLEVLEGHTEALNNMAQDISDDGEFRDPTECCVDLFNLCLEILDGGASRALESEALEELDCDALEVVLKRQTLGVKSEVEVVKAVVRWTTAQCKRGNLPLTPLNRRQKLGNLLFSLRLLKLSPDQVSEASKFLEKEELEYVQAVVSGKSIKGRSPPPTLAPYLKLMATARGPVTPPTAATQPTNNKKKSNKKKYTKKEMLLDIVSILDMIFG